MSNAKAQLSAIIMTEVEDITVYVPRVQELHNLLDSGNNETSHLPLQFSEFEILPMVKAIQIWHRLHRICITYKLFKHLGPGGVRGIINLEPLQP